MKIGANYGIVADSKTRVRCVFCGVFIPKAAKCIEQHTNGAKHKENIELMSENGLKFDKNVLYCKLCKLNLGEEESVTKHTECDEHATWLAAIDDLVDGEFVYLDSFLASESENARCEVCNCNIPCTLSTIEEHVNSFNHRAKVCERLKPLNGIFSVNNDEEVWCKICDTYIDNTIQSILDHIDEDEQHVEWFSEIEDIIEDHDVSIDQFLSNEHFSYAYCNKCEMQVLCSTQSIEDHVNSESHLSHFS